MILYYSFDGGIVCYIITHAFVFNRISKIEEAIDMSDKPQVIWFVFTCQFFTLCYYQDQFVLGV